MFFSLPYSEYNINPPFMCTSQQSHLVHLVCNSILIYTFTWYSPPCSLVIYLLLLLMLCISVWLNIFSNSLGVIFSHLTQTVSPPMLHLNPVWFLCLTLAALLGGSQQWGWRTACWCQLSSFTSMRVEGICLMVSVCACIVVTSCVYASLHVCVFWRASVWGSLPTSAAQSASRPRAPASMKEPFME